VFAEVRGKPPQCWPTPKPMPTCPEVGSALSKPRPSSAASRMWLAHTQQHPQPTKPNCHQSHHLVPITPLWSFRLLSRLQRAAQLNFADFEATNGQRSDHLLLPRATRQL